jgi:hypothetical protein
VWEVISLVCITHVWTRGTIFAPLRTRGPAFWRALADCPLCSGFWIGALGHCAFCYPLRPFWLDILGVGATVGTLALVVYGLIRRI